MSVHVTSWVLKHSEAKGSDRLVLLSLADKAGDDGTHAYPSVDTLARESRCSRRTVQSSLRSLEKAARITREGLGPRGQNRYSILMVEGAQDSHPPTAEGGADRDVGGRNPRHRGGAEVSPEPSLDKPPVQPPVQSDAFGADVDRLCSLMVELSNERADSQRFKVTPAWRREMDRLMRLDGRTPEQVEHVIRWVHADSFWGPNVLGVPKLREKFDALVARIKAEGNGNGRRSAGSSPDELRAKAAQARAMGQ